MTGSGGSALPASDGIGPASPGEWQAALRLAAETFEGFRVPLRRGSGRGERVHCFVLRAGGTVVCALFALELSLQWPDPGTTSGLSVRTVVGLDSLVTIPGARGRGHASRLLEWVNRWAGERGFAGTALFSEIGSAFYEKRGYTLFPMRFFRGALPSADETRAGSAGRGRPFHEDDLPQVARTYIAASRKCPLSVARDLGYWRRQLRRQRQVEDLHSVRATERDFVVSPGDSCCYLRSRHDGDIFTILEALSPPGAEAALWRLARAEMARAAGEGCVRLVLHLPPWLPPPSDLVLREAWYETFLVRPAPGVAWAPGSAGGNPPYIFRPDYF